MPRTASGQPKAERHRMAQERYRARLAEAMRPEDVSRAVTAAFGRVHQHFVKQPRSDDPAWIGMDAIVSTVISDAQARLVKNGKDPAEARKRILSRLKGKPPARGSVK